MPRKVAIIAGEGALPVELARRLAERGARPLVLSLREGAEALAPFADAVVPLRAPSLDEGARAMEAWGAEAVTMAGHVPKRLIYRPSALLDPLTRSVLARCLKDDHSLLGAVVEALEARGLRVVPYHQIVPELLAAEGTLGSRAPGPGERADVERGRDVLRVTLPCSFGQAVVVAGGAVVAVEAMEGTDAMIARAGELAGRGVVVKMMRTDQDPRYDLPTVGPATIEGMARAGLTCLAVEAGRSLVLSPQETIDAADRAGVAVVGIGP